jgi:hypothetical protein
MDSEQRCGTCHWCGESDGIKECLWLPEVYPWWMEANVAEVSEDDGTTCTTWEQAR